MHRALFLPPYFLYYYYFYYYCACGDITVAQDWIDGHVAPSLWAQGVGLRREGDVGWICCLETFLLTESAAQSGSDLQLVLISHKRTVRSVVVSVGWALGVGKQLDRQKSRKSWVAGSNKTTIVSSLQQFNGIHNNRKDLI